MHSAKLLQRAAATRLALPLLGAARPFAGGLLQHPSAPRPRQMAASAQGRQVVSTDKAPGAVGPYSQAIKTGNLVFVSGQLGFIPGTKEFAAPDVEGQAEQVMLNLGAILEAAGSSFGQVVKTTVLLASMDDFVKVNAVYGRYFPENPPARACFAVQTLPANGLVEIEAIAETC